MSGLTRSCLRHRRLVVLACLVLTVVGALTTSSASNRLTHSFATPARPATQ
jgi:RND superfamily putative drug exporter